MDVGRLEKGTLVEAIGAIMTSWGPYVAIITVAMIIDILTGYGGAAKQKMVASGKMREGVWHKAGFYGLVVLAGIYEIAAVVMNFELAAKIGIVVPELPAVGAVCVYVLFTEIVSICENLIILNPEIGNAPFMRTLVKHDNTVPDVTVAVEDFDDIAAKVGGSE